ncbi:MAG: VCBS repeat-containing protein [Proteobacteria bacterium]|nr:VCBS repeat-containing protein [Pseudomonadota bacterium]
MKSVRNKSLILLSLCAAAIWLGGCTDDTITASNIPEKPDVPEPSEPEAGCEEKGCPNGQTCVDNKCLEVSDIEKPCEEMGCPNGQTCVDGKCQNTPDDADSCQKTGCPSGQYCDGSLCKSEVPIGDPCVDGVPCAGGATCIRDYCRLPGQKGEACTSRSDCAENMACIAQTCIAELPKGSPCDEDIHSMCVAPLLCINSLCTEYVSTGDACDEATLCDIGACINGVCKPPAKQGEHCDEIDICADGLICQDGVCLKNYGSCDTNSDCDADSYCCTMDTCNVKHVCFPYGEGPGGEYNEECQYKLVPGLFEASIQCEWLGNPSDNVEPSSTQIMSSVMAADLPFDSGNAVEVAAITFSPPVIRIFNGDTCELLQSIPNSSVHNTSNLALADLDNDGKVEILAISGNGPVYAYHWSDALNRYDPTPWWTSSGCNPYINWGGVSVHDITNDGFPEVIADWAVFDGRTGSCINRASSSAATYRKIGTTPVLADIDHDGQIEFVNHNIWRWDNASGTWTNVYPSYAAPNYSLFGIADFGTSLGSSFDFEHLDGIAEVVAVNSNGSVRLYSLDGQLLLDAHLTGSGTSGGPPNIGDFDGDGLPEIGIAGNNSFSVLDPRCTGPGNGCASKYVLWTSISQDKSSGVTGSSIFDFDSDGKTEVIYGDECYTRIYDGQTGEVLFSSYRTSNTAFENPVIVDVDRDMSAEILIGSDNIAPNCPTVDPNHHGVKCVENLDCFSGSCVNGYCRCQNDSQCNWQRDAYGTLLDEYSCTTPLAPESINDGLVCRAKHPNGIKRPGLRILRDRLDRWASSRPIWNQHAYAVTHVNDDGTVPSTSNWKINHTDPKLNNFRANVMGSLAAGFAPDITGRFIEDEVCGTDKDGKFIIQGKLCNRGRKDVGSKLPATFYKGDPAENNIICTSYTDSNVAAGECRFVHCEMDALITGKLTMVVNDDGNGGRTTVECDSNNNTDTIEITECTIVN